MPCSGCGSKFGFLGKRIKCKNCAKKYCKRCYKPSLHALNGKQLELESKLVGPIALETDPWGVSRMHIAAILGEIDVLTSFSETYDASVFARKIGKQLPLDILPVPVYAMVLNEICDAFRNKINKNKAIEFGDFEHYRGATALHLATMYSNQDVCHFLIARLTECGALQQVLQTKNSLGLTPVMYALSRRWRIEENVRKLIISQAQKIASSSSSSSIQQQQQLQIPALLDATSSSPVFADAVLVKEEKKEEEREEKKEEEEEEGKEAPVDTVDAVVDANNPPDTHKDNSNHDNKTTSQQQQRKEEEKEEEEEDDIDLVSITSAVPMDMLQQERENDSEQEEEEGHVDIKATTNAVKKKIERAATTTTTTTTTEQEEEVKTIQVHVAGGTTVEMAISPLLTNEQLTLRMRKHCGVPVDQDYYCLYECGTWDVFECTVIPEERVVDMMARWAALDVDRGSEMSFCQLKFKPRRRALVLITKAVSRSVAVGRPREQQRSYHAAISSWQARGGDQQQQQPQQQQNVLDANTAAVASEERQQRNNNDNNNNKLLIPSSQQQEQQQQQPQPLQDEDEEEEDKVAAIGLADLSLLYGQASYDIMHEFYRPVTSDRYRANSLTSMSSSVMAFDPKASSSSSAANAAVRRFQKQRKSSTKEKQRGRPMVFRISSSRRHLSMLTSNTDGKSRGNKAVMACSDLERYIYLHRQRLKKYLQFAACNPHDTLEFLCNLSFEWVYCRPTYFTVTAHHYGYSRSECELLLYIDDGGIGVVPLRGEGIFDTDEQTASFPSDDFIFKCEWSQLVGWKVLQQEEDEEEEKNQAGEEGDGKLRAYTGISKRELKLTFIAPTPRDQPLSSTTTRQRSGSVSSTMSKFSLFSVSHVNPHVPEISLNKQTNQDQDLEMSVSSLRYTSDSEHGGSTITTTRVSYPPQHEDEEEDDNQGAEKTQFGEKEGEETEEQEDTKNMLFQTKHAKQIAQLLKSALVESWSMPSGPVVPTSVLYCSNCESYVVATMEHAQDAVAYICSCETPLHVQ